MNVNGVKMKNAGNPMDDLLGMCYHRCSGGHGMKLVGT